MRKWIGLAGLVFASLTAWSALANAEPPLDGDMEGWLLDAAPSPTPDYVIQAADGASIGPDELAGNYILMNFWATWCAPCVEEMPSLDRLQAAYQDQPLKVVAVSIDRGGLRAVEPFFDRVGIENLEVYLDPMAHTMVAFKTRGVPTTLLISPDGKLLGRFEGEAEWDGPAAKALVDYYLGQSTS
ncbi:MAG: TlpA disulfide reductase family protein [Pseudomonadota bacterium]